MPESGPNFDVFDDGCNGNLRVVRRASYEGAPEVHGVQALLLQRIPGPDRVPVGDGRRQRRDRRRQHDIHKKTFCKKNPFSLYTVESASQDGLLQLVPVYLDHILFPKFSESTFKTEIYHVNGKGEEGGTVFAEMQGREGSREDVMALAQQQAL